jgi:hypothetical protein
MRALMKSAANRNARSAVSTTLFAATTIILIIIAAVGFGLYATSTGTTTTQTNVVTTTATGAAGSTATTTITSTATGNGTTATTTVSASLMQILKSGGFLNAQTVTFGYSQNYTCTPSLTSFGFNATETAAAQKVTGCEVGAGNSTAVAKAAPVFVLVPAYAGLSIFGVPKLGASAQGYPIFDNQTIVTDCGAGGTNSSCPFHPTYLYSPDFSAVETHLGIKNGIFGLPQGVLPTPAHDHVVGYSDNASIPWYLVTVLVFDPNIMPNAVTGQCQQIVKSNLTDPTQNCLNTLSAIQSALGTRTTATANANATQNDPIYDTFGGVATQVTIPGVTMVSETSPANANLFLYFNVEEQTPFA